jgi:hypothetical protein
VVPLAYDITIAKAAPGKTCQSVLSDEWCTALAKQLARTLHALIAVGDDGQRGRAMSTTSV